MKNYQNKNRKNFLDTIPIKIHLNCKKQDGNIHLVFYHTTILQKFLRWLTKKNRTSTLELQGLGSRVWENINGENTVYDIIKILLDIETDSYDSMQKRVFTFLRILKNRKIIDFKHQ